MILDTNALSALADGDQALAQTLESIQILALPVVVLGEYRFGIQSSRNRQAYERWLKESLETFSVLPVDATTAVYYAEIRQGLKARGTPIPENDVWIAALSRQHRLNVITRDQHFRQIPEIKTVTW